MKLCPFCGSVPDVDNGIVGHDVTYWVECRSCQAIGPEAEDKARAEDLWNTRFVYQEDTRPTWRKK